MKKMTKEEIQDLESKVRTTEAFAYAAYRAALDTYAAAADTTDAANAAYKKALERFEKGE